MKGRFSTIDIAVVVQELKRFLSMRVVNVYDIDNKTYLIRVGKPDEKSVILIESGIRLHSTEFDWPKNPAPSGFSMKLRKHLKGRRLESIRQLGLDRMVDLQFGSGEAAYHVVVELYDRGNIVLTDFEYTVLNILRPRTDNSQDVRFAVRETYPIEAGKEHVKPTEELMKTLLDKVKEGDVLKKVLIPNLAYGPAVIEHVLWGAGFTENVKVGKDFDKDKDFPRLMSAMDEAESILEDFMTKPCKGYIVQKKDMKPKMDDKTEKEEILLYEEFHPLLFHQHEKKTVTEFDNYNKAVDEFFSKMESQKIDMKIMQQEKAAMKKLDNVKKDHEKRIVGLKQEQETDTTRGQLIEMNLDLVDQAILVVRSALANQIDWSEIWKLVKEAQQRDEPVAKSIRALKLDSNQITLSLGNPFSTSLDDNDEGYIKPIKVDIDLALSAYGNSRKYFDKKKQAARKEQKTVEASNKAFKSAEKKTRETLKDVATAASINRTRKTYWFEKFLWFITSENYLVIGGRDQQQNELIVKRYMKPGDRYVHADLHGASSCVIKNPTGIAVPPKTLNEAGSMAICNSAAWDSKVVTSAWWVYHDQVSKTAPSGEYLTTGSFMVRGKKNYLPPSYLVYGFGFLFKLEDGSVERHLGERRVRTAVEDEASEVEALSSLQADAESEELQLSDSSCSDTQDNQHADDVDGLAKDVVELNTNDDDGGDEVLLKGSDENFSEFPDTSVSLHHVEGTRFELQRGLSTTSDNSVNSDAIYLGDAEAVVLGEKTMSKTSKISAKQRRDMKKQNKSHPPPSLEINESTEIGESESTASGEALYTNKQSKVTTATVAPPKRGQKSKLKKIKERYKDQDEEERTLRMDILASAGPQKEEKRKKGKKGKEVRVSNREKQNPTKLKVEKLEALINPDGAKTVEETREENEIDQSEADVAGVKKEKEQMKRESDGEKEEEAPIVDDTDILNTLTGIPLPEDELLYAIPVCAPYSALINYKFKVKLMPGSTKKGKAVKTALNMFSREKIATGREKDLLKIQKDVDLSRNVPGKVKVAAPNLHKGKK